MTVGNQVKEILAQGDYQDLRDITRLIFNLYKIAAPALLDHSLELARQSVDLARRLRWDDDQVRIVLFGSLLHDVGYLLGAELSAWRDGAVPMEANMETDHPQLGAELLKGVRCLEKMIPVVLHHHEHFNGSGFPDHLAGTDIPAPARVVSLVHAYQTMIRGHSTTPPMAVGEAQDILMEDAGVIHDPEMVKAFLHML